MNAFLQKGLIQSRRLIISTNGARCGICGHGASSKLTFSSSPEKSDGGSDSLDASLHSLARFPWRHEHVENMLPRVTPDTYEQTKLIPTPIGLEFWLAALILKTGWLDAMFFRTWKKNLEDGITFAFIQGLSAVLSNSFQVPLDQITTSSNQDSQSDNNALQISFHYPLQQSSSDNSSAGAFDDLSTVMVEPLGKLFQAAAQRGTTKLRIQLELTPKRSVFHRLYGIPLISRELVETEEDFLLNLFFRKNKDSDTYTVTDQSHFVEYLRSHTLKEVEAQEAKTGHEGQTNFVTTVAAEAMIICEETFCVWDADTGEVLQGYDKGSREVGHLVTMERNYETLVGGFSLMDQTSQNWIVTDIDDLLGPKKWYHVVAPGQLSTNHGNKQ